jgi:dienelactone hydrolase
MRRIVPIVLTVSCTALLFLVLHSVQAQGPPGQPGPYTADSVTVTTTNPSTSSELVADIYFPASDGSVDPSGAPYPALVFAHGFMAPRSGYVGYGEHLGSWGYIIILPSFPDDDGEVRASDVQYLLSYLEAENTDEGSPFFQMIDTDGLGMSGHSLGGMSTLMVTARDDRVSMAGVPLDPAGGMLSAWDYETEAPSITAPIAVVGAPSQLCNSNAEYEEWYLYIGATHKAKFVIANGTHCDFMNTDDESLTDACGWLCGEYSAERSAIAERYTTAWFNYYMALDTDYYTYLYGDEADEDIQAGLITRTVDTAPRDVAALGGFGAVELSWTLYDHPIIDGYNIYRSQQSGSYPGTPYAQVGRESSYVDTGVVAGQEYFYVLRSRDSAGNEHQPSDEVSATPRGMPTMLSPPNGTVTTTQAITFAWQAGAGSAPQGYNLKLDDAVITTTGTTSATILSLGVHTWTVRAYTATAYSDWVTPAWTVEVITLPTTPVLLHPPNGTVTTTQAITFAWQAGTGSLPQGYNLQLDGWVITTTDTTSATILPTGIHTWTVRAYNEAGYSEWVMPAWTVTVIAPPVTPTLLHPPNGIVTTTQAITFAWQAGAGPPPQGYNLKLDGAVVTTTGTTSATILPLGVHTWTVRAYNEAGYSGWVSPAWTVEITDVLPPPAVPTLLAPPNGTITTTQAITFAWQAGAGPPPQGYNLKLDGAVVTTTGTTSATILPTGIHTWTVRAYNEAGYSGWATPAWTIEVHHYYIYLPLVLRESSIADSQ